MKKIFVLITVFISTVVFVSCSRDSRNEIVFKTGKSVLIIDKKTGILSFYDWRGKRHFKESVPLMFITNEDTLYVHGAESTENTTDSIVALLVGNNEKVRMNVHRVSEYGFNITIDLKKIEAVSYAGTINLNAVEQFYGFGEMWNGKVGQRGEAFDIWDVNGTPDECAYMPYFVSTNNYTFFINYGGSVHFDVGKTNPDKLTFTVPSYKVDLMFVSGDRIASAVRHFMQITGMPALPPKWAFKPWAWLMSKPDKPGGSISELTGHDLIDMVNHYQKLNIPVGVTWMEPPWQTARTTFIPNPDFDPNLKKTISELDMLGVKTLAWTVPYTTSDASNWDEAIEKEYIVRRADEKGVNGKVRITESGELSGFNYNYIDLYNKDAYDWFKAQISLALQYGIKGFKLDAGQSLEEDAVLYGGIKGADVHNSYAVMYNKVFYDALKEMYDDDFLMIPRAVWTGSNRYTNFKWPGDLSCSYEYNGLPSTVYSSLSLAFSGFPFLSTDIGGFSGRPSSEKVWIAWAKFGAMLPGMQTLNMPWWYSDEAIDVYRYLSWLHIDMIPYWYSLAIEAHDSGAPVCRPLVWSYQDDRSTWNISDEFTVGNALLVAPIITGDSKRDVYLPEGNWINFWNEREVVQGKQIIEWAVSGKDTLKQLPLFIKEGSIIPMKVENEFSGFGWAQRGDYTTINIWPKTSDVSSFTLKDKNSSVMIVSETNAKGDLQISMSETKENFIFRIYVKDDYSGFEINLDSRLLPAIKDKTKFRAGITDAWNYDQENHVLWVRCNSRQKMLKLKIIAKK